MHPLEGVGKGLGHVVFYLRSFLFLLHCPQLRPEMEGALEGGYDVDEDDECPGQSKKPLFSSLRRVSRLPQLQFAGKVANISLKQFYLLQYFMPLSKHKQPIDSSLGMLRHLIDGQGSYLLQKRSYRVIYLHPNRLPE